MDIIYKINTGITAEEVAELFLKSGINRPCKDLPRIKKMLDSSNLTITAWINEKLVGIARALTDFCYCCYLSDLAVDKKHQHKGIGKELIKRVQKEIGEDSMLLLLSAPGAMEYYPKVDFDIVNNGFIINRKSF
ncbi:MAG: GNAT family N-acetyltransferase [Bacteroidota bacterium]|nr:GNAT family N-acetyltransferase [Bacteroidota bacterium]